METPACLGDSAPARGAGLERSTAEARTPFLRSAAWQVQRASAKRRLASGASSKQRSQRSQGRESSWIGSARPEATVSPTASQDRYEPHGRSPEGSSAFS